MALSATGLEAQAYQAALKAALADPSVRQVMMQQPELRSLEHDLLTVVRSLSSSDKQKEPDFPFTHYAATLEQVRVAALPAAPRLRPTTPQPALARLITSHAILIRAPSL